VAELQFGLIALRRHFDARMNPMFRSLTVAAVLATAIASPAAAVTFIPAFTDTGANVASVTKSNISLELTVTARRFFVAPGALTNFSQTMAFSGAQITRSAAGLGINGGGSSSQMDTNNAGSVADPLREAFLVSGSNAFFLTGLRLTSVDADDTLKVYGINDDDSFVDLGFGSGTSATVNPTAVAAGTIRGGAAGQLTGLVNTAANGGTADFGFVNETRFSRYLITTRLGGDVTYLGTKGQGFALQGLTATVPEPQSWALMILGFGLVGVSARRRQKAAVAA
jgi:hypothetical protein